LFITTIEETPQRFIVSMPDVPLTDTLVAIDLGAEAGLGVVEVN
jgi:hypothetical protein